MNKVSLLIILSVFDVQCRSVKHTGNPAEDILKYCNFVNILSPFEMKIIDYWPGCYCGSRGCASNCIGVTNENDTIRVLSLCNVDSSFKKEQFVIVSPKEIPKGQVTIAQHWVTKGDSLVLPKLHRVIRKTIYGSLSLKK